MTNPEPPAVVELPDDLIDAAAKAIAVTDEENDCFDVVAEFEAVTEDEGGQEHYIRAHGYPSGEYEDCEHYRKRARAALAEVYPLIAARVRAEYEPELQARIAEAVAAERQRWKKLIAAHIGPEGVGGHYQAARNAALRRVLAAGSVPVAKESGRLVDRIAAALCAQEERAESAGDGTWRGWSTDDLSEFIAGVAVGSVPVATPPTCEHGIDRAHDLRPTPWEWSSCPGPVATQTGPEPLCVECCDGKHRRCPERMLGGCCCARRLAAASPVPAEQPPTCKYGYSHPHPQNACPGWLAERAAEQPEER